MKSVYKKLWASIIVMAFIGCTSILFAPTGQAHGSWYFGFSQGYAEPYNEGYYGYPQEYSGMNSYWPSQWRYAGTRISYSGCRVMELRRYCRYDGWGNRQCIIERRQGWRC